MSKSAPYPMPSRGRYSSLALDAYGIGTSILRNRGQRTVRTSSLVQAEYQEGAWAKLLREAPWRYSESLGDFLFRGDEERWRLVHGQAFRLSYSKYLRIKALTISNYLSPLTTNIVEFGCGYGWNLLALRELGFRGQLLGVEIAENGVNAGLEIMRQFHIHDVPIIQGDMVNEGFAAISEARGLTAMTYLAIEQIPNQTRAFLERLPTLGIKSAIFFENDSLGSSTTSSRLLTKLHLRNSGYQSDLAEQLKALSQAGLVRSWYVSRPLLSPRLFNEVSAFYVKYS